MQRQVMGKQTGTAQVEDQQTVNGEIMLITACITLTCDRKTMNIQRKPGKREQIKVNLIGTKCKTLAMDMVLP